MKKAILILIIAVSLLTVVAGASVGIVYAFTPSENSVLAVSVTTQSITDEVTVVLRCEGNESGNTHINQFGRMFAYIHQFQFNNSATEETM